MRDIGEGTIRRIDWQELTPAVLLLRVFTTAIGARVMFLSLAGLLVTFAAAWVLAVIDGPGSVPIGRRGEVVDITDLPRKNPSRIREYLDPILSPADRTGTFHNDPAGYLVHLADRSVLLPWHFFSQAGERFFSIDPGITWRDRALSLLWFISLAGTWSFFGGMICRTVAYRLTIDQSESIPQLYDFVRSRGLGFLTSFLILFVGIIFLAGLIWISGRLFTVPVLDYLLALLFPLILLAGFLTMLLLIGLWFGWPLLYAAISVEGTDGFDAVSRMFSYIYQRPFHYCFYWALSALLGLVGFVFITLFINSLVILTTRFGGFPIEVPPFALAAQPMSIQGETVPAMILSGWCFLTCLFVTAYAFSWFWTSGVAIYLILRRSVDATPFVEVFRTGPDAAEPTSLPPIKLDEQGAPEIVT